MSIPRQAEAPPLRLDDSGALRVGSSNVLLDIVIRAFQEGATPETIVQRHATLSLADTRAVIAHYLRHRGEGEAYLAQREAQAAAIERRIEADSDLSDIRARLRARDRPPAA